MTFDKIYCSGWLLTTVGGGIIGGSGYTDNDDKIFGASLGIMMGAMVGIACPIVIPVFIGIKISNAMNN